MDTAATTSTMLASDPVSSLRAAALSTLKAKRRKFVPEKTAPSTSARPPPPDSFQLDYGQEDNIPDAPMVDLTLSDVKDPSPSAIEPATTAEDPNREEGEISEEEEPPLSAPPTNYLFSSSEGVIAEHTGLITPRSPSSVTPLYHSPEMASPPLDPLSDPFPNIPLLGLDEQLVVDQIPANVEAPPPFFLIGPENVRPGLTVTQDEYDTIKNIILDLLGWAVPVEDLIESGLSKEVIYYVFNELNLQLPDTFDITGIVPYNPETFSQTPDPDTIPLTTFPGRPSSVEPDSPTGTPSIRATTPPAPTKLASTFDTTSNADLHDMERRRRQELMARKAAVQASRKLKPSIESFPSAVKPEPSNMETEDLVMTPIASDTVEDFLKSLAPVPKFESPPIVSTPPQMEIFEANDADEVIMATSFGDPESQSQSPHPIIPISATSADSDLQHTLPPPSSAEAPPTSVDSSTTTFSHSSGSDPELLTPSDVHSIPRQAHAPPSRRGTKRPVASDFVDFDPTPRRNEINTRHERSNGFARPAPARRLTGFHNIGGSRRCVIDLSDSEEDGDIHQSQPIVEDQTLMRRDKWNTMGKYPSPVPSTKPPSTPGTMSPATLMQKEHEIRKMRELIAQREEETRLRRLALARSTANSEATTPSNAVIHLTVMKQEETDADMRSPALIPTGSKGMAPLPPTFPLEPPWEDSTMTTLPGFSKPSSTSTVPNIIAVAKSNYIQDSTSQAQGAQVIDPQVKQKQQAAKEAVDVDSSSSPSTQMTAMTPALQKQNERKQDVSELSNLNSDSDDINDFSTYRSPFESFPLLRDYPGPVLLSDPVSSLSSSSASYMYPPTRSSLSSIPYFVYAEHSTLPHSSPTSSPAVLLPNLKPLKLASLVKLLDPFKRLCQYEVPGGGTCRDDGCEDVHLSRLEGANQMGQVEPTDPETADYLFKVMPTQWLAEHRIDSSTNIQSTLQHLHQRDNSLCYEDRVARALMALGPLPAT